MGVNKTIYNALFVTLQDESTRQTLYSLKSFNQWEVKRAPLAANKKAGNTMLFWL